MLTKKTAARLFSSTILVASLLGASSSVCASVDWASLIATETAYLVALQHDSGAIKLHHTTGADGRYHVNPYFASLACLGLLHGSPMESATSAVRRYLTWHFDHLNDRDVLGLHATIYDYTIDPSTGAVAPTYTYDSVDSYAAVFLTLLGEYYDRTADGGLIQQYAPLIGDVAYMLVTQADPADGLTKCRPDYPQKYLMDNAEVVMGLKAAAHLYRDVLGDSSTADYYQSWATTVANSIDSRLWGAGAVYRKGKLIAPPNAWYSSLEAAQNRTFSWGTFYPDAVANLFPLWCQVWAPSNDHVAKAYAGFCNAWPNWPSGQIGDSFPWALMAYSAAVAGDVTRASQYVEYLKTTYIDAGHPYPWTCNEAGFAIRTAAKIAGL